MVNVTICYRQLTDVYPLIGFQLGIIIISLIEPQLRIIIISHLFHFLSGSVLGKVSELVSVTYWKFTFPYPLRFDKLNEYEYTKLILMSC